MAMTTIKPVYRRPTVTHTLAELEVSKAAYNEITAKLKAASYDHVFIGDGLLDMTGIALVQYQKDK